MLTVNDDVSSVACDLFARRLSCPGCGGGLRPWGWARQRPIRHGIGADRRLVREHPRRGRCADCGATHVLLSVNLAARRADGAAVIAVLVGRDAPDPAALWPASALTGAGQAMSVVMAYARVLAVRFGIGTVPWHGAGLAAAGPWFFSAAWWAPKSQHELALGAGAPAPRLWSGRRPM